MSDEDLRRLERAHREGGGVDAHARWIAARVRAGELGEHRARLAAAFGHDAAARALGVARGRPGRAAWLEVQTACTASRSPRAHAEAQWILTGEGEPPSCAREPELAEEQVHARIALAAAREALAAARLQAPPDVAHGLERLAAWVACPCAAHREALREVSTPPSRYMSDDEVLACFVAAEQPRIRQLLEEVRQQPPGDDDADDDADDDEDADGGPAEIAGFDAWDAYRWVQRLGGGPEGSADQRLAFELTRTRRGAALLAGWGALDCLDSFLDAERAVLAATFVAGEDELRDAVAAAIGAWLLREEA